MKDQNVIYQLIKMAGKTINQLFKEIADKWASTTKKKMRQILISKGKANSRIIKNFDVKVRMQGPDIIIDGTFPDYAEYTNNGRKPGKPPPIAAMIAWCKRKGITKKHFPYYLRWKVGKKGLPATNFMDPFLKLQDLIFELQNKSKANITQILIDEFQKTKKK